eukprot:7551218-Pyramimonas_sp.AAC.1
MPDSRKCKSFGSAPRVCACFILVVKKDPRSGAPLWAGLTHDDQQQQEGGCRDDERTVAM